MSEFGTTTSQLLALADWLAERRVTLVGMEATGVYWKPVHWVLEASVAEVWVINARHMRNVPGHKTDVADAVWGASLLEHGLVRPSFIPPEPFRALRDLTRYRKSVIEERASETQRLHKVLEDAGVKLSSVASSVLTKSGREMIDALIAGERDPSVLAEMAKGRMRSSKNTYLAAQYAEIRSRRGPQRAAVAVGHSILVIAWHLLSTGEVYNDLGGDYFDKRRNTEARQRRLVAQLEAMGHHVTLEPAA